DPRSARRLAEGPAGRDTAEEARLALGRVRKALTAYTPGMYLDRPRLRESLATALPQPEQEAERLFALGWLGWLEGDPAAGEPWLDEGVGAAGQANATGLLAEAAYWRGRVRILLDRADAVAGFEAVLRSLGGSPQATAWFVDLLGRAGWVDRA